MSAIMEYLFFNKEKNNSRTYGAASRLWLVTLQDWEPSGSQRPLQTIKTEQSERLLKGGGASSRTEEVKDERAGLIFAQGGFIHPWFCKLLPPLHHCVTRFDQQYSAMLDG